MSKINIALLGGDKREIEVAKALLPRCRLSCFGLPAQDLPKGSDIVAANTLAEALGGASAVLLPMAGVGESGRLYAPLVGEISVRQEDFAALRCKTPVLVGVASDYLRGICRRLSLPLYEVAENDWVAIPNAVPTAEGALQVLMQETDITLSGMKVLLIGFGRVGEALASRLRSLGARVVVANRGEKRTAKARAMGFNTLDWAAWHRELAAVDAVINTVPAKVLERCELAKLSRGAVVLDLASGAGGVDWTAAEELGVRACHALSLPGKVAPVSAGRILGEVYPRFLREICGLPIEMGTWGQGLGSKSDCQDEEKSEGR